MKKKSGDSLKATSVEILRYLFFVLYVCFIAAVLYRSGSFFEAAPLSKTAAVNP